EMLDQRRTGLDPITTVVVGDVAEFTDGSAVDVSAKQCSDFPAIILPIDVDDREHNEVGVDERDYAAKTDPAIPKNCGERDISDRADKRKYRNERPDYRSPDG